MSHTTASHEKTTDTSLPSPFAGVMELFDQTGIGYEVVYSGSDRSCPLDSTPPARAA